MPDPVVDAHEILRGFYTLGTPLTPISIRDQMVRGSWLVDRLVGTGALPKPPARLVVVGAGAGGATAAIRAAQHGVQTYLIEKLGAPFSVQAGATTRWIDPVQYDWPADHWRQARFPWGIGPAMPLGFGANFGSRIATMWTLMLYLAFLRHRGNLLVLPRLAVHVVTPSAGKFNVTLTGASGRKFSPITGVDAVIWAIGFGAERHTLPTPSGGPFPGKPFWGTDSLTVLNCGHNFKPNVLVIGAGDGALQDFLRAATRMDSARQVIDHLGIPSDLLLEAFTIESQAHAALTSSSSTTDDERIYQKRHRQFEALVNKCPLIVGTAVRSKLRSDVRSVVLACGQDYFTAFYGLNCFVVLLLLKAGSFGSSSPKLTIMTGLKALTANSTSTGTVTGFKTNTGTPFFITADEVVIRIGINPSSATLPITRILKRTRHHLPFHVP